MWMLRGIQVLFFKFIFIMDIFNAKKTDYRFVRYTAKSPNNGLFEGNVHEHSVLHFIALGLHKKSDALIMGLELSLSHSEGSDESRYGTLHTSNCCKKNMVLKRGSRGCHCAYPVKIDLLLLKAFHNPDWGLFLKELSSQLGLLDSQIELVNFYVLSLSRLNISINITPATGIAFSATSVATMKSELVMHKVKLDAALVGDYELLSVTWFQPPSPSPDPFDVAASPTKVPVEQFLANTSVDMLSNLELFTVIGAGILMVAIISTLAVCLHRMRQNNGENSTYKAGEFTEGRALSCMTSAHLITYEELKQATNNFETASILGEGGFGRVYRGVLRDGTAVAIKRLMDGGQQGDKEFSVEVNMLSRLHHRNLVKLIGYCSSQESSQNLLCCELVPNGSLETWLHGPSGMTCPLPWETRLGIALDVARGLAYLHEDSLPCVIHRDLKASNILLDDNFHAKISDLGLAKQASDAPEDYISTRVMGTFGYVAPEYAMTGHLMVRSDVYSYGVVLLELLTGRKPVDMSRPPGQENLVTWARPMLGEKGRLEELADPKMDGKYPRDDFSTVCTVAAACVVPEAGQRPAMGEVVQSLKIVQRVAEYGVLSHSTKPTGFVVDGLSSVSSSGHYSHMAAENSGSICPVTIFSEDLQEGR